MKGLKNFTRVESKITSLKGNTLKIRRSKASDYLNAGGGEIILER